MATVVGPDGAAAEEAAERGEEAGSARTTGAGAHQAEGPLTSTTGS